MNFVIVAFVFFVGLSASILRKKLFKKIMGLYVSLNSIFVLMILIGRAKASKEFESFAILFLCFSVLLFIVGFLSCHYAKRKEVEID